MERGTPGYELVDKTEDLLLSIGRKLGIQNPFAAQQAVIEENREGQIGKEVTDKENRWIDSMREGTLDIAEMLGSAYLFGKVPTKSTVPKLPPRSNTDMINVTPGGALTKTTPQRTQIPSKSSSQLVQTSEGQKIRLHPGTLNLTTIDGQDAQVFLNDLSNNFHDPAQQDLIKRIENALKINKEQKYRYIPEEKLDKSLSDIDRLALVTKDRVRKYVKEFGGTEADVNRILAEQKKSFRSIYKTNAWLNAYFKQLSEGLPQNLKLRDVRIADIDGTPRLVNKNTGKGFKHAFEVDHRAAKVALGSLGIEGADIWENLDIVYTVFNRAKNTQANNPMIPREFSQALGESTSLREFVGRRMSKEFNSRFTKIPQEVRELVRESMIQDLLSSKGSKGDVKRIVARQIDLYSNPKYRNFVNNLIDRMQTPPKTIRIEQYDAIMEDIEVLLRHIDNQQHQLRYEELIQMPIWNMITKKEQINFINLHDQYVSKNRGLGAQIKSKEGRFYGDRDDT